MHLRLTLALGHLVLAAALCHHPADFVCTKPNTCACGRLLF